MMALFKFLFCSTEKQITPETQKSVQCGTWTKHAEGGVFTSPNYPSKYPPDRECVYIIEGKSRRSAQACGTSQSLAFSRLVRVPKCVMCTETLQN